MEKQVREKLIKKWKKENFLVVALLGVLILVAAWPAEKSTRKGVASGVGTDLMQTTESYGERDEYVTGLEHALSELLASIEGVGENKVMITMKETTGSTYLSGGNKQEIEGVAVSAKGAGNGKVAKNISEVIQALFGLDAHKIKIAKMI